MPPVSPASISDHTLRLTVYAAGSAIPDFYPLVSVRTHHEINRIPTAEIVFQDGSVETGTFPISDSSTFVPGAAIKITAGYDSEAEQTIFTGIVVKQEIKLSQTSLNLVVTCKHDAVKATFNKVEQFFAKKKDSDAITSILGEYGLSSTVDATSVVHESLFQKLATDWDFVLSRADFCGLVVICGFDKKILVKEPAVSGSDVLRVAFGESIMAFSAELNAERQPPSVETSAWDPATLAAISSNSAEPSLNAQGNLTAKKMGADLSQKVLKLNSGAPMTDAELKVWANSSLLRSRLSALKGSVTFIGNAAVTPDNLILLEGVGERFNGSAYVSAVTHDLEEGVWKTTVKFGLENRMTADLPDFSYKPAVGQLPAIHGLQVGTVKKLDQDPGNEFRIQVTLSATSTELVDVWARVSNFYATATAGSGFLPEVGDEVVVGFFESNPSHPVVLGSLYSSKNAPENTPADSKNYKKGITTKSKLKISFDDEKKITTIETPGGNKFKLDDDAKEIDITDQNSNSIKMTSSGITITSSKDLTLTAKGSIKLDATAKMDIASKADVAIAGLNIANTAKVGFTAKGNATAEISASGQTVVKGAIVMIN